MKEIKPKRLSRRALIESFLEDLTEKTNTTIEDLKFGNGYFIMEFGKDTVCTFKIKELPDFLFAIWNSNCINKEGFGPEYENSELILFTQPILNIDKFKPSRSAFRVPLSRYIDKPNNSKVYEEHWFDYFAVDMINFMLKHKYRAFCLASNSDVYPWEYISGFKAFITYYNSKLYDFKENIKEKRKLNKTRKDTIKVFSKLNVKAILSDYGDRFSPRLHIHFYVLKNSTEEDLQLIDHALNYLEDKYFNCLSMSEIEKYSKFKSIAKRKLTLNKNTNKDKETIIWTKI